MIAYILNNTTMKSKIIFTALITLVLSTFLGCAKLDEVPKGTLTPVTYFKTQSDLDAAVASIFERLVVDGGYAFDFHIYSFFGSDDLTADPNLAKASQRNFDQLSGNPDDGALRGSQWETPWAAIYQANNILANYDKVSGDATAIKAAAGQAYFLRAWSYFLLVRTFGPLPVILAPVNPSYQPNRDPVADVYAAIVKDLQTAADMLPVSFPGQPGKVTKWAAKALLADVYMNMATWPLNQADKYALSAAAALEVMNSHQYTLVPDYAMVFKSNNNSESIFSLQFNVAGGNPNRMYGNCAMPWEEYGIDGNFGWEEFHPEINFYKKAPVCKRTHDTFYDTLKLLQTNGKFLKVPYTSMLTRNQHPYYRKFRNAVNGQGCLETDSTIISMNPSTDKTKEVIRYPMVLLDYAESSCMAASGPTAQSYAAINEVRARAGEAPLTPGLSMLAFRDSVVYERAYEFAGEWGHRWFDIVRLQLLPKVIADRDPKENPISGSVNIQNRYLAPIPRNELSKNPQWSQNAGY